MNGPKDATPFERFTGKGVYPVEYARMLLNPLRHLISPVWLIVRRLGPKPTDQVLEIGCGPGYFSPGIARALPKGTLMLFDFQDGMLDLAEARLKVRGLTNYDRRQGDAKAMPFADASFDVAFMVTVLGEVGDAMAALKEAARVIKPGGRLSVTEMFGDPDFVPREEVHRLMREAGFFIERDFGPRAFFTCNARKPG